VFCCSILLIYFANLGGDEELAVAHDLFRHLVSTVSGFEPDVEAQTDDIDVGAGAPGGAGVFAVGIAKGNVDAGKFFVLQDVADDAGDADVGADGEFADAVGVFVGVSVGPEVLLELLVDAAAGDDAILLDLYGEGHCGEQAVARAEPVANYAINYKGAVDFAGACEAFAAGEIAPFFRRDDAGGFEPPVVRVHVCDDAGACSGCGANAGGAADTVQNLLRESVNLVVVGAHAVAHDFGCDVDHMGVAHVATVDHIRHLHPRMEFVGLHLHGEDGDLRSFHIFKDGGRHVRERTRREVFEDESVEGASALGELGRDRGRDGLCDAIGDEGNLFVWLNTQTGEDGGAGAGDEVCGVGLREEMRGGGEACDDRAPSNGNARSCARIY
jgi:hypothetical protein